MLYRRWPLLLALFLLPVDSGRALTNGIALTPPMGWNSWNNFGCGVNEGIIKAMADAMATNGMKAAGYQFINIDDCWQVTRDFTGAIVSGPAKFPSGIKVLANYVHADGLSDTQLRDAWLLPAADVPACIAQLLEAAGPAARLAILPQGPQTIPYIAARPSVASA